MGDVKLEGLIVRKTKFQKTRLVPLHETAAAGLERYLVLRKREASSTDHIFISRRGRCLSRQAVHPIFRRLLKKIGLDSESGGRRPRIHDIRHTFAVRALEACAEGRDKISQHVLTLSTYMGHTNVNSTYWHLEEERDNVPSTRIVRLAAIKSFFRFLEYRERAPLEQIRRVLTIPFKKTVSGLVDYLRKEEVQAIVDSLRSTKIKWYYG